MRKVSFFMKITIYILILLAIVSCKKPEIRRYQAAKVKSSGDLAKPKQGISWDIPEHWETLPPGGMRMAGFSVTEGDAQVEITVVSISGGGDPLANLNRWRKQLKLPEVTEENMDPNLSTINTGLGLMTQVKLLNADKTEGMRVAILKYSSVKIFFKMTGTATLVDKESSNFELFLTSLKHK